MIQPNNSKYICQVDKLPNLVPFQRLFEGSTGPTPAQHLLWLPSLEHHPYAISLYLRTYGAPCRAPGLRSFPADGVPDQVDCPHGFVDLQRFGEGLWPERWRAGRLWYHFMSSFWALEPRPPLLSTRPLLLQCQCFCDSAGSPSHLSMFLPGPVRKTATLKASTENNWNASAKHGKPVGKPVAVPINSSGFSCRNSCSAVHLSFIYV